MKKFVLIMSIIFIFHSLSGSDIFIKRFDSVVKRVLAAVNEGDIEGLHKGFNKNVIEAFPMERSSLFFKDMSIKYGKIKRLGKPKVHDINHAVFPAYFERGILDIKIILDHDDLIAGLWFLPHTPEGEAPEKNGVTLSLPFKGEWLVLWGGDTEELNYHHNVPRQRYAFDFVVVDEKGRTHKGNGTRNEDYYAFGREILAPGDGIVTDVVTGVRDNKPGSMNPSLALGNVVFIQHSKNEVSVIAHLKNGSTQVKVGEKVKKGQVIGLCGNSGNSSEPHLHYHLQNTPVIQNGIGIKVFFDKVVVRDKGKKQVKKNYSPIKGEIVSPPK